MQRQVQPTAASTTAAAVNLHQTNRRNSEKFKEEEPWWSLFNHRIEKCVLWGATKLGFSDRKNNYKQFDEKRFREIIVAAQSELHSRKRNFGLYFWVKTGDLVMVKQMVEAEPDLIFKRDAAGASVFHIAYLFQHYDIAHYLETSFPTAACLPYNGKLTDEILELYPELEHRDFTFDMMPYAGANILHVCIVRRNYEEVRWLLDFYYRRRDTVPNGLSTLLTATAMGKFFHPDGDFYLGGIPLHFAVCANHREIFDVVMAYASRIDLTDALEYEDSSINTFSYKHMPHGSMKHSSKYPSAADASSSKKLDFFGISHGVSADYEQQQEQQRGVIPYGEDKKLHANGSDVKQKMSQLKKMLSIREPHEMKVKKAKAMHLSHGPSGANIIFLRDVKGNTVLHLCVLYGLQEMYHHVTQTALRVVTQEIKALYARYVRSGVNTIIRLQSLPYSEKGYAMLPKVITIPERDKYDDWVVTEAKSKVEERFVLALNEDLHSPLTLAAEIIKQSDQETVRNRKIDMFQQLIWQQKQLLWAYGAIKTSRLRLEGIEIPYDLDCYAGINEHHTIPSHHAAIDWLCINDADPRAIMLPEIQQFIETKWERVGYPKFLVQFLVHCLITILMTMIVMFINATPRFLPTAATIEWILTILYPLVVLPISILTIIEVQDFCQRPASYLTSRGVAKFAKVMRSIQIVSFWVFFVFKILQYEDGRKRTITFDGDEINKNHDTAVVYYNRFHDRIIKHSLMICIFSCWLNIYSFLMGFDTTGPFMLTIFKIISRDVPYFCNFYLVIVIAFGCSLSLLSNTGNNQVLYGFLHLIRGIWSLIQHTVGFEPRINDMIDITTDFPMDLKGTGDVMITLYYCIVVILMLNLLIAMISSTYNIYEGFNHAILLIEKYNLMNAMERQMNENDYQYYRKRYSYHVSILIDSLKETLSSKLEKQTKRRSTFKSFSSLRGIGRDAAAAAAAAAAATTRHGTLKGSNYFFEIQERHEEWFSTTAMKQDQINATKNFHEKKDIVLLIINPQVDYYPSTAEDIIDFQQQLQQQQQQGNEDTNESSLRIVEFIKNHRDDINRIIVALKSHHPSSIFHRNSWEDENGDMPNIGTVICRILGRRSLTMMLLLAAGSHDTR